MVLYDETKPLLQGETTGRVAPMHFIFARKNLDNKENRPQKNLCEFKQGEVLRYYRPFESYALFMLQKIL